MPYHVIWYGVMPCYTMCYIWCRVIWCGVDIVLCGVLWCDMVLFYVACYGMVMCGAVLCCVMCCGVVSGV